MSAVVDTNILVRHLTGDPPDMVARATAYLESEGSCSSQTWWPPRPPRFLSRSTKYPVLQAAEVYETERVGFAEAYLVACAESTGVGTIASFDRSLDRDRSIERIEPPAA